MEMVTPPPQSPTSLRLLSPHVFELCKCEEPVWSDTTMQVAYLGQGIGGNEWKMWGVLGIMRERWSAGHAPGTPCTCPDFPPCFFQEQSEAWKGILIIPVVQKLCAACAVRVHPAMIWGRSPLS